METNHRINSIDIARLFAAILVIAIHTQAIMWSQIAPTAIFRY